SREDLFTIYVVSDYGSKNSKVIKKADAVIFVARKMRAPLPFLATVFDAMPKVLTNLAYDLVAKNRYRFFGRYDTCLLPGSKDAEKFIEV
ncbi:MAG: DCC1-like thiol-disulfide oxidoreductase family protein, partial [Candidatus Obscuribacterales bacterium]|nr:DCC1-like thiol-disulfide oxidoreductase family protein [Candidatus Obscuribacterales bacterium]